MKNSFFVLITLSTLLFSGFQTVLEAQTTDKEHEAGLYEKIEMLMHSVEKKRLATSGFDIQGKVTDVDGKPLDAVRMTINPSRPNIRTIVDSESKTEKKIINSDFHIQENGWDWLDITFSKDGYYIERLSFSVDQFDPDPSKRIKKETIQVKMIKREKRADLFVLSNAFLKYDIGKDFKTICDLSSIETSEGLDRRDYRNTIKLRKVKLGTKPDATKYFELDFPRDEHDNILFDIVYHHKPFPSAFIIRYHSDSPDDGMIPLEVPDPNLPYPTLQKHSEKTYTKATESGYLTKEIIVKIGEKKKDAWYSSEEGYIFVYFKCGSHYGKARFSPTYFEAYRKSEDEPYELGLTRTEIEVYINAKKGDRNLTYY